MTRVASLGRFFMPFVLGAAGCIVEEGTTQPAPTVDELVVDITTGDNGTDESVAFCVAVAQQSGTQDVCTSVGSSLFDDFEPGSTTTEDFDPPEGAKLDTLGAMRLSFADDGFYADTDGWEPTHVTVRALLAAEDGGGEAIACDVAISDVTLQIGDEYLLSCAK